MLRIDLRYVLIIVAFYAPGALTLIGAWMLGYSTVEVREFVGSLGLFVGFCASSIVGIVLFTGGRPIWFEIGRRK